MKKVAILFFTVVLFFALIVVGNYYFVGRLAKNAVDQDSRNSGFKFEVRFSYYLKFNELTINLIEVGSHNAPLDLMRSILQISRSLEGLEFEYVNLQRNGQDRFIIPGSYFYKIGQEFGIQNPIYTVRTFPENVLNTKYTHAFRKHDGGVLAVAAAQLNDFKDFADAWVR